MKREKIALGFLVFVVVFLMGACASQIRQQQKKAVASVTPAGQGGEADEAIEQTPEEIASTGIADLDKAASELDELGEN